jgi:hypothetical protein
MKIIDKINRLLEEDKEVAESALAKDPTYKHVPKTWYSYEYFPPKTVSGKYLSASNMAYL